jgi:hypothetical protein
MGREAFMDVSKQTKGGSELKDSSITQKLPSQILGENQADGTFDEKKKKGEALDEADDDLNDPSEEDDDDVNDEEEEEEEDPDSDKDKA